MKLASLKTASRDGRLVVVSKDLTRCVEAPILTLQAALDDWAVASVALEMLYDRLERDTAFGMGFDPAGVHSPLPRAYAWCDGSAYLSHMVRVRRSRGAEMPPSFNDDPLMYQGGSDTFIGPRDPIAVADAAWGIDFEAEVAIVTDDVPMGVTPESAAAHIVLVMLCNDVSLRNLIPPELAKGFGFFQSKPSSAFSPVAVTPATLGTAWADSRLHRSMLVDYNGVRFGECDAGMDLAFDFARLIAHAAKTRALSAGTIIGSGTVSNADEARGGSCLQEARVIETIRDGKPTTPFMQFGDRVKIEMLDADGTTVFGAIEQVVEQFHR